MSYAKNLYGFCALLWYLTSGKNFMVIRSAPPEILGGWFSKRADTINREAKKYTCKAVDVGLGPCACHVRISGSHFVL